MQAQDIPSASSEDEMLGGTGRLHRLDRCEVALQERDIRCHPTYESLVRPTNKEPDWTHVFLARLLFM